MKDIDIREVTKKEEFDAALRLIEAYLKELGHNLSYQNIEKELSNLAETYPSEKGGIVLAFYEGQEAGVVAIKHLEDGICEMKRLYVDLKFRGLGIGKALCLTLIQRAKTIGYKKMRLDTVKRLKSAVKLYRELGFEECKPYVYNPFEGALFFEKIL